MGYSIKLKLRKSYFTLDEYNCFSTFIHMTWHQKGPVVGEHNLCVTGVQSQNIPTYGPNVNFKMSHILEASMLILSKLLEG